MKLANILTFAIAIMPIGTLAQTVCSPDGRLVVDVTCPNGTPLYTVTYDGVNYLEKSPLGLNTNIGDFTKGLKMSGVSDTKTVKDSYSLPNIKKSHVDYNANTRSYTFAKDGKDVLTVQFNVADNDVAFRYTLPVQGDTRSVLVYDEATGYVLPEGATTFLCPQMKAMTGFARTAPSYETNYSLDQVPMGNNGWGDGYTFPCLFRNGDNGWMLLSETGLDGTYCGSHLSNVQGAQYKITFPNPDELNGAGSSAPAVVLPATTPWRTITVGKTLAPIAETTVAFDVVEPQYQASKPYKYGKGTWSWIIKMDPSCNFDEQKRYIDFAADMGYESVLVDALWDTQIGYDKIEELAKYGKDKGVDLYLWYNSNGAWNDAPQGPRGKMDRSRARRQEMAWMQKNGIRGIKVDFFGGDKQQMIQLYEDILSDANDYGIMVIFHGCTLPRGWDRMYPNFAAAEAVLASENLHFSQGMCDAEASNATIHPLVRNTVGSMDFGGSALNKYYNATNETGRGSKRQTSDVFALATAVLFQSPVQHFALAPNNLTDAPAWAIDFMKAVPTTWDDVKYIDGYPGKYLIMARRNGNNWYIAAINAQEQPLDTEIELPMLKAGKKLTVYSDDADLNGSVKQEKLAKDRKVKLNVPRNGATLIVSQ